MIPSTALHYLIALETAAMAKPPIKARGGIPLGGNFKEIDGKIKAVPAPRQMSVSAKIAQGKSKKIRVTKRTIGAQRP